MELPPAIDIDTKLSPTMRSTQESARSTSSTVEVSRPINRKTKLSLLGPKSIRDSASSSSGPTARPSDLDPRSQMYSFKVCQEECQLLQDQIRDLDRSMERADEHLKGLQSEMSLSANGMAKCLASKDEVEQKLTKLRKAEKDLTELYVDLKALQKIQDEEITDLATQVESLQTMSESIGIKLQIADQKVKELDEENRNLQTMMEGRDHFLPIKKRNTLSGDGSKNSTGTSTKGNC